jgi:hypothetical protein
MRTKWMLTAGGVVAVAALLVVGQLLMNRGTGAPRGMTSDGVPLSSASTSAVASDATRAPLPPLPRSQAGLRPVAPAGPFAAGEPLPPLSSSPPGLITSFQEGLVPPESAYMVTVRPWGLGPDDPAGRTAVVTVDSIAPAGAAPDKFGGLKGHAILIVMNAKAGGTLERGGRYSAVLSFTATGGRLVPSLSEAHLTIP